MQIIKNKLMKSSLAAFILSLAVFLAAIFSLIPSKGITAEAYSQAPSPTVTLNYIGNTKYFNSKDVNSLYTQLISGSNYNTIKNLTTAKRTNDFSKKDIVVSMGGFTWTPVFLSKDTDGNPILTLLQNCPTLKSAWSGINPSITTDRNYTATYPFASYSYSLARSVLVGSQYTTDGKSLTSGTNKQNSDYSTFIKNYDNLIVTPAKVSWQKDSFQFRSLGLSGYNMPSYEPSSNYGSVNNSWSKDATIRNFKNETEAQNSYMQYLIKNEAGLWQNDKLWLPSEEELGYRNEDYPDRVNSSYGWGYIDLYEDIFNNSAMLRSTLVEDDNNLSICTEEGYDLTNYQIFSASNVDNLEFDVYPAFHLNLATLNAQAREPIAKPSALGNSNFTFDGTAQGATFNLPSGTALDSTTAGSSYASSKFSATDYGTYTLKIKPASGKVWTDGTESAIAYKTISIAKKSLTLTANAASVTYGNNAPNVTFKVAGLVNDDAWADNAYCTIEGYTPWTTGVSSTKATIKPPTTISLKKGKATNYTLGTPVTAQLTVTARPITENVKFSGTISGAMTYDGTTVGGTSAGSKGITVTGINLTGFTGFHENVAVSSANIVLGDSNVGTKTYKLTNIILNNGNYTIDTSIEATTETPATESLVNPKEISISGGISSSGSKVYDATTSASGISIDKSGVTFTGVVDSAHNGKIDISYTSAVFTSADADSKQIKLSGISLTGKGGDNTIYKNYKLKDDYTYTFTGDGTITQRELKVKFTPNKTGDNRWEGTDGSTSGWTLEYIGKHPTASATASDSAQLHFAVDTTGISGALLAAVNAVTLQRDGSCSQEYTADTNHTITVTFALNGDNFTLTDNTFSYRIIKREASVKIGNKSFTYGTSRTSEKIEVSGVISGQTGFVSSENNGGVGSDGNLLKAYVLHATGYNPVGYYPIVPEFTNEDIGKNYNLTVTGDFGKADHTNETYREYYEKAGEYALTNATIEGKGGNEQGNRQIEQAVFTVTHFYDHESQFSRTATEAWFSLKGGMVPTIKYSETQLDAGAVGWQDSIDDLSGYVIGKTYTYYILVTADNHDSRVFTVNISFKQEQITITFDAEGITATYGDALPDQDALWSKVTAISGLHKGDQAITELSEAKDALKAFADLSLRDDRSGALTAATAVHKAEGGYRIALIFKSAGGEGDSTYHVIYQNDQDFYKINLKQITEDDIEWNVSGYVYGEEVDDSAAHEAHHPKPVLKDEFLADADKGDDENKKLSFKIYRVKNDYELPGEHAHLAGEYYVKITGIAEDFENKYQLTPGTEFKKNFTISPREVEVKINDLPSQEWGDNAQLTAENIASYLARQIADLYTVTSATKILSGDVSSAFTLKLVKVGAEREELSGLLDAGKYKIVGEATKNELDASNYTITFTDGSFEITKRDITFTLKSDKEDYKGEEFGDIDVDFDDLKSGSLTKDTDYELSFSPDGSSGDPGVLGDNDKPKGAGKYTVTVTLKDTAAAGNYNITTESATFTVNKADITFTLQKTTDAYTGLGQEVDVEFDALKPGDNYTKGNGYTLSVETSDGDLDGGLPKTVGTYTVKVVLSGDFAKNYNVTTASQEYEITKASLTFKDGSAAFNGAEHQNVTVEFEGLQNGETLEASDYTVTFEEIEVELSNGHPKEVGEYTMKVELNENSKTKNYNITTVSATFTVTDGLIEKPNGDNIVGSEYSGEAQKITLSNFNKDQMSGSVSQGATFDEATGEFSATDVGTYTLTVTPKAGYKWTGGNTEEVKFTIEIKEAELTFTMKSASGAYAGKGQDDLDVVFDGLKNGQALVKDADYTLSFETSNGSLDGDLPKNVGDYTVKVQLKPESSLAKNYKITTESQTYEITKATLTFKNGTGEYNGEEHQNVTVVFIGLQNGETLEITTDYTITFEKIDVDLSNGYPKEKGEYKITVALVSNDKTKNYKIQDNFTATYTVSDGTVDKPTTTDGVDGVVSGEYNGKNLELTVSGYVEDKMSYTISPSGKGAEFNIGNGKFTAKDANTYTLTITPKESYKWTDGGSDGVEFKITISKKQLTITANPNAITYGSAASANGVVYGGFVIGESESNLSGALDYDFDYTQGGAVGSNYKITPKGYTSDNYDIHYVAGTLTVNPKPIDLTIADGGHAYGEQPQTEFEIKPSSDFYTGDSVQSLGAIVYEVRSRGVKIELSAETSVGEYEIWAESKVYGNYDVTFTAGKYVISAGEVTPPTEDTREFTYTGEEITYMPEGFDDGTMTISGNVKTEAGTYTVRVELKENLIFKGLEQNWIEFEFKINAAKIVKLNDNGNVFMHDEFAGGAGNQAVMLAEKDEDGKFKNFGAVGEQGMTIWATRPLAYTGPNNEIKPAKPEFGAAPADTYINITDLDISDINYPIKVDLRTVGKYVVYYHIVADNHEVLEGEWRVAVQKDTEVTKVIFKKAVTIKYGDVPTTDELFELLKDSHSEYLSITRNGEDVSEDFFNEATGVTYGLWRKNQFGKYYDCGEYYINFVLPDDTSRTVIYRDGGNDSSKDTNRDKLVVEQLSLSLIWDTSKLTYTYTGEPISLENLAAIDITGMADDWKGIQVRFELADTHDQVITAAGVYEVVAILEGTNAKNYCFAEGVRTTNTVVVTSQHSSGGDSGNPDKTDSGTFEGMEISPFVIALGIEGITVIVLAIVLAVIKKR